MHAGRQAGRQAGRKGNMLGSHKVMGQGHDTGQV